LLGVDNSYKYMKFLLCLGLCSVLSTHLFAQVKKPTEHLPAGRTVAVKTVKPVYADSVQFNKAFAALYPLLKPTPTITERAEITFSRMGRMLKARGVDSTAAHDSLLKALDPTMDRKILFDTYRSAFTAKELESLVAFFKTPVGKHYLEIENRLLDARSHSLDQYVQRTISMTVVPLEKPVPRGQGMPHTQMPDKIHDTNTPRPVIPIIPSK